MAAGEKWRKLWRKRLRFFFCLTRMKIESKRCVFDFEQPDYVKVANVTRAGCEKASTGQFELLR